MTTQTSTIPNRLATHVAFSHPITVISWNSNKLATRDQLLQLYLNSAPDPCPDIIVIQEPGNSSATLLKSTHKVTTAMDLLIYHRPNFKSRILSDTPEASIISLTSNDNHHVVGCYLRNGNSVFGILKLQSALHVLNKADTLVIGDLNSRLPDEGSTSNSSGRELDNMLNDPSWPYVLMNDLQPTFHREGLNSSMLDICLASGHYQSGFSSTLTGLLDFSRWHFILSIHC